MRAAPPGIESSSEQIPCSNCPFVKSKAFRAFSEHELDFVQKFKCGELQADPGATLFLAGTNSAHLYTVLSGWAFRYKLLEDGRRQILNFALPGDFLGLQSAILNEMDHTVEALTTLVVCIFPRQKIWTLFKKYPDLAFDVTWLAARSEKTLDDNLLTVGQRTAKERIAFLLLHLFNRLEHLKMVQKNAATFPFTQSHIADALGLSLVHTNKTLKRLERVGAIKWQGHKFELIDKERLADIAGYDFEDFIPQPFI